MASPILSSTVSAATESQLNFAYYSKTEETPKVKIATKADMSDAKEVEGKQTQAVAIEGVQYYSNKASVNELKENTTYYYQVFQNGKYQDVQKYSTKSFKNYSFLYVGDPQIGASSGQTSTEGARIIVIVNKSGTNAGFTVYSQDRTMAIYGFAFACIIGIMFPIMYRGIAFCRNHHFSIRSRHGRWYVHCIYDYDLSYRQLANSYVIGIEIMQGLSGSLGVVLTVPITALIASFLAVRKK